MGVVGGGSRGKGFLAPSGARRQLQRIQMEFGGHPKVFLVIALTFAFPWKSFILSLFRVEGKKEDRRKEEEDGGGMYVVS